MFGSTLFGKTRRSLLFAFAAAAVAVPVAQATADASVRQPDRALADAIAQVEAKSDCVIRATYVRDVNPFSGLVNDRVRFLLSGANTQTRLGSSTDFVNVPISSFLVEENLPGGVAFQVPSFAPPSAIVETACDR
jgi:hypothetical protein